MFDDILKPEETGCLTLYSKECVIKDGMMWTECPAYKRQNNSYLCVHHVFNWIDHLTVIHLCKKKNILIK
jgi:hypothetical protein